MGFVTLWDFFRQHLLQTHHDTEANKRAEDRKSGRVQEWSSLTSGTRDFRVFLVKVIYLLDLLVTK